MTRVPNGEVIVAKTQQQALEGEIWFSLTRSEVVYSLGIDEQLLQAMEEEGICSTVEEDIFDQIALSRIRAALRLQRDLRVNLPGVALVLELLAEIERLRRG